MGGREIRAYGPNYDTDHLAVDLDKKVRSLGGATIVVFGEDPDLRAMQSRALADSLGLKLVKDRTKAWERHNPAIGATVALRCTEPTATADTLVREWVADSSIVGPRILIIEVAENSEIAVSALDSCALFVKVDNYSIPAAGMGSTTTVASDATDYADPNLCSGFTNMSNYPSLMADLAGSDGF